MLHAMQYPKKCLLLCFFLMRETYSECKHAKLDFIEHRDNDQRFMMLRFYCWWKVHGGGRFVNISWIPLITMMFFFYSIGGYLHARTHVYARKQQRSSYKNGMKPNLTNNHSTIFVHDIRCCMYNPWVQNQ